MGRYSNMLMVSDFDRTLTDYDHKIPKANIDAINYFISEGGLFTVGTGRARNTFLPKVGTVPLNAPCIVSNGAEIYDYQKMRYFFVKVFLMLLLQVYFQVCLTNFPIYL